MHRQHEDLLAACRVVHVLMRAVTQHAVLHGDRRDLAGACADQRDTARRRGRLLEGEPARAPANLYERHARREQLSFVRVRRGGVAEQRLVVALAQAVPTGRLFVAHALWKVLDAGDRVEHDGLVSDGGPHELAAIVHERSEDAGEAIQVDEHTRSEGWQHDL